MGAVSWEMQSAMSRGEREERQKKLHGYSIVITHMHPVPTEMHDL